MSPLLAPDFLRSLGRFSADLFFPHRCGVCEAPGAPLCETCFSTLPRRSCQVCSSCGARETPLGAPCIDCSPVPEDGIFAACPYTSPAVARLIHTFKYRFVDDFARSLGKLLAEATLQTEIPLPDFIVPVPLHSRRERWRGWNQSALLARSILNHFPDAAMPVLSDSFIVRNRHTPPQMSLDRRSDRERNMRDAFAPNPKMPKGREEPESQSSPLSALSNASVWIVDDVAASGSTIRECAKVLKTLGAKSVWGIVVAR